MEYQLRPKDIIVVGGATGIGYHTAQKLLNSGCENIILASRNQDKLEAAAASLKHSRRQKVYTFVFDISKVDTHNEMIKNVHSMIGRCPDGLVIASGVNFYGGNWKGFNISEEDWDRVMDINLKGSFFLLRNFSNYLFGYSCKGNICVLSSISAHRDLMGIYQITKNALSGIVHCYGKYLCERGIVLNCVEPGTTNTDMMKHLSKYTDGIRKGEAWGDNSVRRLLRPEEIADVICFCMSDLGEVLSGACILAGGGCKSIAR